MTEESFLAELVINLSNSFRTDSGSYLNSVNVLQNSPMFLLSCSDFPLYFYAVLCLMLAHVCCILGGIALAAQAISPIATHFSAAWSVCLSSVV